jgi:hypothetical protein
MAKWKLKGCPRCKGDLLVERAGDKWDEYCLQCGYRRDLKIISPRPQVVDGIPRVVPVENSEVAE